MKEIATLMSSDDRMLVHSIAEPIPHCPTGYQITTTIGQSQRKVQQKFYSADTPVGVALALINEQHKNEALNDRRDVGTIPSNFGYGSVSVPDGARQSNFRITPARER